MPADLDDYFTAFQAETMSTPAEPTTLRRAAERRARRRTTAAVSAAAFATVAILGTAVALAAHSATPPLPTSSPSAGPQPSTSPLPSTSPQPSASPQPSSSRQSAKPNGAACENSDLKMGTAGGDGFAGGSVVGYSLTNVSDRTCSLSGFIRTRYLDSQGRPAAVTSQHDGTAHKINLRAGQIGYFPITYGNVGPGYNGTPCTPPYGRSEYYLPGQATPFHTEPAAYCPRTFEQIGSFTTVKNPNWHG